MKIVSVVGARPQFVKAAALTRAFAASSRIVEVIVEVMVHTGQHFDEEMSAIFFSELAIPAPAHTLGVHGGTHTEMTGRMLPALESVYRGEQPECVLVYGDTNTTLAGALAAAKLHVPVAHVEAGLRSYNRRMPEEVNRVVADHLSRWLFCPTRAALGNLAREGIVEGVHPVGDVMYDAALHASGQARARSGILDRLDLRERGYFLATVHRAENTDRREALERVLEYLRARAAEHPVVFPVHPRTRQAALRFGLGFDGLRTCEPLGYLDFARLLLSARGVLTDSGGLQKEAYFQRVPCITLRSETEWVETVEAGWNRLWGEPEYAKRRDICEYGDGHAAERIAEQLLEDLGSQVTGNS